MEMTLHALPDDFYLRALDGMPSSATAVTGSFEDFLVDESGNYLVDESGNFLVAQYQQTLYMERLTALPDDFTLHAE